MKQLLSRILDAHGGMDRWRDYEKVEATIAPASTAKQFSRDFAIRCSKLRRRIERADFMAERVGFCSVRS
jgi:hypothetical protein